VLKCSYRKCRKAYFNKEIDLTLIACANTSWKKQIHRICFEHFLYITELQFKVEPDIVCCATVRCCSKFKQQLSDWICWDADGPNGPNTLPNSQLAILDWWMNGNNYHLFRGGKNVNGKTGGLKKSTVRQKLSEEIKKQGIIVERTPHHVGMKKKKMEEEYKNTLTGSI
jgi:hypothetical protein